MCIHKPPHTAWRRGDISCTHLRRGRSLFKFEIHLTYKRDIYILFYQFALTEKRLWGSRGGRTTPVVKPAPERGDKKAKHAGEEIQMSDWELTLILWKNKRIQGFPKGETPGNFWRKNKETEDWFAQSTRGHWFKLVEPLNPSSCIVLCGTTEQ